MRLDRDLLQLQTVVTMEVSSISMDWVERYDICSQYCSSRFLILYRSIYLNPLNIAWSVFNSIMLMFYNVGLLVLHTPSFEANVWAWVCRSSFWWRYSNRWNCAWIYVWSRRCNRLTCLNLRCKLFMMSFRLAMSVTSECLPAGHGNVCVSLGIRIYWVTCPDPEVHAMQSKPSPCTVSHCIQDNDDDFFLDYAINHNLTPFISMQNHYNLLYREEEREMFPTINVRLFYFRQRYNFNTFLAFWRWFDSLVASCSRSSCASFWKWYGPVTDRWVWTSIFGHISLRLSSSDRWKTTLIMQEG